MGNSVHVTWWETEEWSKQQHGVSEWNPISVLPQQPPLYTALAWQSTSTHPPGPNPPLVLQPLRFLSSSTPSLVWYHKTPKHWGRGNFLEKAGGGGGLAVGKLFLTKRRKKALGHIPIHNGRHSHVFWPTIFLLQICTRVVSRIFSKAGNSSLCSKRILLYCKPSSLTKYICWINFLLAKRTKFLIYIFIPIFNNSTVVG